MRRVLNEAGRGRRLELSAIVASIEAENLYYGMDLREWVRQELVDTIIPYTSAPKLLSGADSWVDPSAARFFFDLTRGTRCKLAFNLMPRDLSPPSTPPRAPPVSVRSRTPAFWDGGERARLTPRVWGIARRLPDGKRPESRRSRAVRAGTQASGWDFRSTPGVDVSEPSAGLKDCLHQIVIERYSSLEVVGFSPSNDKRVTTNHPEAKQGIEP
jgi:hypothetical protein